MSQLIKVFATRPGNLSSIPQTHGLIGKELTLTSCPLTSTGTSGLCMGTDLTLGKSINIRKLGYIMKI